MIGVISDTHGRLPGAVLEIFDGVEAILHAGDVGDESILTELETLAPVHAVLGNVDGFAIAHTLPLRLVVDLTGLRIGIAHGHLHGDPSDRHDRLRQAFQPEGVDVVVYGHTHTPCCDASSHPWVINPGSPSQSRGHGRSVGLLSLRGRQPHFEIVEIA